jgi:hypothetical protein
MKFIEPRPFADSDVAARKLMELANGIERVQDGRIHIEKINEPCSRARQRNTWQVLSVPSPTAKFTEAGAALIA